ncbi:MAG: hypothetical protein HQ527_01115 [Cyanobacteria bacterium]|nr:hypothetical protein [Cyanobacteria bacterium bin.51]
MSGQPVRLVAVAKADTLVMLEGSTSVVPPGVERWWRVLEQPETGGKTLAKGPVL